MSVRYKITPVGNRLTSEGKPCYSITIVGREKLDFESLLNQISSHSTISAADVLGVIEALTFQVAEALKRGQTVTIQGLGTFYISAKPIRPIENPKSFDSRHVKLKRIGFKADSRFKRKFGGLQFTKTLPNHLKEK